MRTEKELWKKNIQNYDLSWPDENIIRYLYKSFELPEMMEKHVLDFGCGSGRNTVAMAKLGFYTYAMDYNQECLDITKKKIDELKNVNEVYYIKNNRTDIPLMDESMDCIICWGSLFYLNSEDRKKILKECYRVLKPGGKFFSNWRSKEDFFYKKGKEIEKDYYILNEDAKDYGLEGIPYFFTSDDYLSKLFEECGLNIYNIEKKDFTINNMHVCNSHWHIWAEKDR